MNNLLCPFKLGVNVHCKNCEKEKCEWWVKIFINNKSNNQKYGCAIKVIANKQK